MAGTEADTKLDTPKRISAIATAGHGKDSGSQISPLRVATTAYSRPPRAIIIVAAIALIAGLMLGGLIVRQRMKAHLVIMSVNGAVIDKDEFFDRLQAAAGTALMRQMIQEDLQLQLAQKRGIAPSGAEVNAEYAKVSQQPGFSQNLMASGLSVDEYKHSLQVKLAQVALLTQGITVSDAEVRAFYDREADPRNLHANYYTPETVKLAVIQTASEEMAQKAQHDLDLNIPFATVAATYSIAPSAQSGGELPSIQRGRTNLDRVPGMEQAVFSLPIGRQLGPRKFANTWWIIRCLDRSPAAVVPFATVKSQCRQGALLAKGLIVNTPKVQKDFQAFEAGANIQAFWPQYRGFGGAR